MAYVITIKEHNEDGLFYASSDNKHGYVFWSLTGNSCKHFRTIESAEDWFNAYKDSLFKFENMHNYDLSTIEIRRIKYEKIKSLKI